MSGAGGLLPTHTWSAAEEELSFTCICSQRAHANANVGAVMEVKFAGVLPLALNPDTAAASSICLHHLLTHPPPRSFVLNLQRRRLKLQQSNAI